MGRIIQEPYFQVPQHLVTSGLIAGLSASALKLYIVLCHEIQRFTRATVHFSNAQMSSKAGFAEKTLIEARKELEERGLIRTEKDSRKGYRYTVLDSRTGTSILAKPAIAPVVDVVPSSDRGEDQDEGEDSFFGKFER